MCVNAPEYMEAFFAAQKLGCVPVNVNYRYVGAELAFLLDNSDSVALVYHDDFAADRRRRARRAAARAPATRPPPGRAHRRHRPARQRARLRGRRSPRSTRATPASTARSVGRRSRLPLHRRHDRLPEGRHVAQRRPLRVAVADGAARVPNRPTSRPSINAGKQAATLLPACPLMHGTGLFIALSTLSGGGTVVLLDTPRLDPEAVWSAIEREHVQVCTIVGDAFAAPAARRARSRTRTAGISRRCGRSRRRASRGARRRSAACSRTCPTVTLDRLAGRVGRDHDRAPRPRASDDIAPARFKAGERLVVVTDDGDVVQPGRRTRRHARRRRTDPARLLQGPGEDGGDVPHRRGPPLLDPGRLRDRRPRRDDPAARARLGVHQHRRREGVPRRGRARAPRRIPTSSTASSSASPTLAGARWSWRSCNRQSDATLDETELAAHCRATLAGYKVPKHFVSVDSLQRSPAGKADYKLLRHVAEEAIS